jgi:benzodiazapine receptor
MNQYTKILVMVATCLAVGYLSSFATSSGDDWFATIKTPSFYPGSSVFAPVWTVLYIMMGIAAGLVWARKDAQPDEVKTALTYFWIQLALNALWSVLFFAFHNPFLALIEIVVLWLMIYETLVKFRRIYPVAGYLLIPYLLWVTFATILNGSIWWINR